MEWATMAASVRFKNDIRRLFTDTDIQHMSWFCDLSKYEDVRDNADDILDRLTRTDLKQMPPTSADGPWPQEQIDLFRQWKEGGCLP
jgi:hypothetical protein